MATHIRNWSPQHTCRCTCVHASTHTQTTSPTAEQEVMGISRKYHKMVDEAFFSPSFFMGLNNNMSTNQRCLCKVVFHFLAPHSTLVPFPWSCRNMLTKCVLTFPKAKKSLNINTMCDSVFKAFQFHLILLSCE